jgi:integrase
MMRLPKYVYHKRDRHGGLGYWYYDRPGYPRKRLPGLPGSREFMDAYEAAAEGKQRPVGANAVKARTMNDLAVQYLQSEAYLRKCKPSTQTKYVRVIDEIRRDHGHRMVAELTRQTVFALHQRFISRPSVGNLWLKVMSNMLKHAVKLGWREDNPCRGVEKLTERGNETQPWSIDQLQQYRDRWPVCTMQRLAFELLLWTGRRLSDVRLIGPQHIEEREDDLYIVFRQVKAKSDEKLYSFVPAELKEIMDGTPQRGLVFVTTEAGSRFASDKSFGNYLSKAIKAAGIESVTAHGLRATMATAVADSLGTVHQIKAVTGHLSDNMAKKYTGRADRRRLARTAIKQVTPILRNKGRTKT